jgi:hypothetical protein
VGFHGNDQNDVNHFTNWTGSGWSSPYTRRRFSITSGDTLFERKRSNGSPGDR